MRTQQLGDAHRWAIEYQLCFTIRGKVRKWSNTLDDFVTSDIHRTSLTDLERFTFIYKEANENNDSIPF